MAKIVTLLGKDGVDSSVEMYPQTVFQAVRDASSNKTLQTLTDELVEGNNYININEVNNHPTGYPGKTNAVSYVPLENRKPGLCVTYKDSSLNKWIDSQFIGLPADVSTNWTNPAKWQDLGPVSVISQTENYVVKAGDTSVGEIPVVSVVQNTETGHTDISVGGVTTPVASVEEVSQLEQKVTEYPYLINSTPEANKRIRELYLIGLDPTKRYYFKFLRYYSSGPYIQGRIYSFTQSDHSDEAEVARTPDSAPLKGIAQFGERNSSGVSGYVVYDFETSDTANFTPEVNVSVCSVLAFSPYIAQYLKKIATADINSGAVTTEKIADGAVTTEKIADGAVTKEKFLPDVPFVTNNSTNLINPNGAGVESGKYLIVSTGLPTGLNAGYTTSDFFPVMPGVGYVTSDDEVRYVCFYDAEKVYLGSASAINGVKTTNFTTPAGAYLCRVSLGNNHNFADLQIAIGVDNTDFFQFKDKYADTDKQLIGQPGNFSAIRLSGTIAAGGNAHANERLSTEKNTILIAKINGTISSCVFGVGWREESPYHYYSAYWVEVTPTRLIIHWYDNNSDVTLHTFEHGINLDDKTTVCIQTSCNNTKQSNIRLINGKGDVFAKTIFLGGAWKAFLQ